MDFLVGALGVAIGFALMEVFAGPPIRRWRKRRHDDALARIKAAYDR